MTEKIKSSARKPAPANFQREPNPRQRILVVEDDKMIRRLNCEVLTYSGYHVDTAEDGAAAWDALQLNHYDLMVTDNDMPKVTGVELLQRILAANLNLPIIMASGTVPEEEFTRYPWLQPNLTLLKPYTFEELLAAVKEVLRVNCDARAEIAPPPNWRIQPLAGRFQI
jgi:DNA-binding response OmpR family regulator